MNDEWICDFCAHALRIQNLVNHIYIIVNQTKPQTLDILGCSVDNKYLQLHNLIYKPNINMTWIFANKEKFTNYLWQGKLQTYETPFTDVDVEEDRSLGVP